jgi:hypothetical protein
LPFRARKRLFRARAHNTAASTRSTMKTGLASPRCARRQAILKLVNNDVGGEAVGLLTTLAVNTALAAGW